MMEQTFATPEAIKIISYSAAFVIAVVAAALKFNVPAMLKARSSSKKKEHDGCPDPACHDCVVSTSVTVGAMGKTLEMLQANQAEQYGLLRDAAKEMTQIGKDVAFMRGKMESHG